MLTRRRTRTAVNVVECAGGECDTDLTIDSNVACLVIQLVSRARAQEAAESTGSPTERSRDACTCTDLVRCTAHPSRKRGRSASTGDQKAEGSAGGPKYRRTRTSVRTTRPDSEPEDSRPDTTQPIAADLPTFDADHAGDWRAEYMRVYYGVATVDELADLYGQLLDPTRSRVVALRSQMVVGVGKQCCAWCHTAKNVDAFEWRTVSRTTRRPECADCHASGTRICLDCSTPCEPQRSRCGACLWKIKINPERLAKAAAFRNVIAKLATMGSRACPICHSVKPDADFANDAWRCVVCAQTYEKRCRELARNRDEEALEAAQNGQMKCARCGIEQCASLFTRERTRARGRNQYCRRCTSERGAEGKAKRRRARHELIGRLGGKCMEPGCDVTNLALLELNHIDREKKTRGPDGKLMVPSALSVSKLSAEHERCGFDVWCVFHHRVISHRQRVGPNRRPRPKGRAVIAEKLRRGGCANPTCRRSVTIDTCAGFDFDHPPGVHKTAGVAFMSQASGLFTMDQVVNEMKCTTLLCANCHKLVTDARRVPTRLAVQPIGCEEVASALAIDSD